MNKRAVPLLMGLAGSLMVFPLFAESSVNDQMTSVSSDEYEAALQSFGVEARQAREVAEKITAQIAEQRAEQDKQWAGKDPFAEVARNLLQ
jgi:hypothetical protein